MNNRGDDAFVAAMTKFHAEKEEKEFIRPQKPVIRDVINISSSEQKRTEVVAEIRRSGTSYADTIIHSVCYVGEIKLSELKSPRRLKTIVYWRQICMYLLKKHTRNSLPWIGRRMGGRDHTTVLYACRKLDENYETYRKDIELVESFL